MAASSAASTWSRPNWSGNCRAGFLPVRREGAAAEFLRHTLLQPLWGTGAGAGGLSLGPTDPVPCGGMQQLEPDGAGYFRISQAGGLSADAGAGRALPVPAAAGVAAGRQYHCGFGPGGADLELAARALPLLFQSAGWELVKGAHRAPFSLVRREESWYTIS